MNDTLKQIERFHGHLGPYVVIGYRMGLIANKKLGSDPFSKKAVVSSGKKPPISCIVDGIQISSGCTLGKGNILINDEDLAKAEFSNKDGKQTIISLKSSIRREIETKVTKENMVSYSEEIFNRTDEELFEVS